MPFEWSIDQRPVADPTHSVDQKTNSNEKSINFNFTKHDDPPHHRQTGQRGSLVTNRSNWKDEKVLGSKPTSRDQTVQGFPNSQFESDDGSIAQFSIKAHL